MASGTPSSEHLSPACQLASVLVIGPVELVIDGRAVSLRSSRTRRLVAMLALYRDRAVSADRLIDAVWGESLPADPPAALQSQLSRLRSSLGAASAGIETVSGGYRLRSDVIGVDVDDFDRLLGEGGGPAALALVRGAAFEDLEVDDAYIEARRVGERVAEAQFAAAAGSRRSLPTRRVPAPVVELVGRERDLAALAELLATQRIVTLTGPGGVGKTTLALTAVRDHCQVHGVRDAFVDLALVSTEDVVPDAFARALGVDRLGDEPWAERLAEAVGHEPLLLVVDNAEHVAAAAAAVVADLVAHTATAVVATSRVPLDVRGEHLWLVEPLDSAGSALDLFEQRARAVRPAWAVTREDEASVREICRRVDGLPLAIELAAAQLRWRTAAEVASSLERPLDSLDPAGGGRARVRAGVRAVIDRSYRLLDERQQAFLDQLGVFSGGFTAESAAAVTGEAAAVRHVGALVQHSLVRVAPSVGRGTRYALLDLVRHFAVERLDDGGGGRSGGARDRHATALRDFVEGANREMWGPDEAAWVARLDDERADVCAAHRHLLATGDIEGALRLATAAYLVAWPRGWSDLRGLIRTTLTDEPGRSVPPDVLAPALGARADFALHAGEEEAAARFGARAVDSAAAGGRPELGWLGQATLADLALFGGRTEEAMARWTAAEAGWAAAHPGLSAWAGAAMALALLYGGRAPEARERAADAVAVADRGGCATARAFARFAAGEAAAGHDPHQALRWMGEAITIGSGAGAVFVANLGRLALATAVARRGDPERALAHYPTVLQEWRRSGQWAQQWITLRTLVPVLADAGAHGEAAVVLGALRAHGQGEAWGADGDRLQDAERRLQARLGEGYGAHLASGAGLTPAELVLFAEEAAGAG